MAFSPWTPILLGLVAVVYSASGRAGPAVQRFASMVAALSMGCLISLGATWPSLFTLLAIAYLPAFVLLAWQVVSPQRFRSTLVYVYLVGAVWLSAGAFAFLYNWLNGGCVAAGVCPA